MKMRTALLLMLCSVFFSPVAHARLFIDIDSPSGENLPVAVVPLKSLDGSSEAGFGEFGAILERDLRMSGLFRIISHDSFLEPSTAGIESKDTAFDLWRKSGADALIKGGFRRPTGQFDGQFDLELRLFDVQQRDMILGKRYRFPPEQFASVVHAFADQVIGKLTGTPGVFSTTKLLATSQSGRNKEIVEMNIDGSQLRPVVRLRSISLSGAWSRDGRYVAFTSYVSRNPDLYIFERKANRLMKLSSMPGLNLGAAFHPREDLLAAAVSNGNDPEIVVMNYSGKVIRTLTDNSWIDIEPTWSPDGKMLAFVSNQSTQPHIYRINADGSGLQRLTYKGYHNVSPAWSPRGDKIAFAGRDQGYFDIFIMNPDGSQIQRLTSHSHNNEAPSWSPNGQMIAFSSDRSGKKQIYIMGADGRGQTQVTEGVDAYSDPAWSPVLAQPR